MDETTVRRDKSSANAEDRTQTKQGDSANAEKFPELAEEGMSNVAIAEVLGVDEGTVRGDKRASEKSEVSVELEHAASEYSEKFPELTEAVAEGLYTEQQAIHLLEEVRETWPDDLAKTALRLARRSHGGGIGILSAAPSVAVADRLSDTRGRPPTLSYATLSPGDISDSCQPGLRWNRTAVTSRPDHRPDQEPGPEEVPGPADETPARGSTQSFDSHSPASGRDRRPAVRTIPRPTTPTRRTITFER